MPMFHGVELCGGVDDLFELEDDSLLAERVEPEGFADVDIRSSVLHPDSQEPGLGWDEAPDAGGEFPRGGAVEEGVERGGEGRVGVGHPTFHGYELHPNVVEDLHEIEERGEAAPDC